MGIERCGWESKSELYRTYHDEEWGVPLHDDQRLFEFLSLESFQSGLSWLTILRKRENFRKAFAHFAPAQVAQFGETKIQLLLDDKGIVRNQMKIKACINNAKKFIEIQEEFGSFDHYIWKFVDGQPQINHFEKIK